MDTRAASEVIGVVLLSGLVITGSILVTLNGGIAIQDIRSNIGGTSTENTMEEIDTRVSSLASVQGFTRSEFHVGEESADQYSVVQEGYIELAVNRNASCTVNVSLSSIRYEDDEGNLLAFEAGGIWKQTSGQTTSTMHTPPHLTFSHGSFSLSVANITGEINRATNSVSENLTKSNLRNQEIRNTLFQGTCVRPNNVTLTVHSDFYGAWGRYVQNEFDTTNHTVYDSNKTVVAFFEQDKLPEETDDYENDVVDLTSNKFNDVEITNTSIKVNKSANNTYVAIATPLSSEPQVSEIRSVESDEAFRPPLDVVFVMDESGSMGDDPDNDGKNKSQEAKTAAKTFVGEMNTSFDRAGAVGFDDDARFLQNNAGQDVYLSDDFTDVNESIDQLDPGGGTHSAKGLKKALASHGLKSNSSRKKVIILLSDGKDDAGAADPVDQAEKADRNGIIIHSIGFGDPDNATMEAVAETTGGTYRYVNDSDELSEVFEELFAQIAESKQVVRPPLSHNLSTGSKTYQPQIDGDTSHIANTSDGYYNLNDPLLPSEFSYSIDISDGDNVTIRSISYDCNEWERTNIIHENKSTGEEYAEVRCTDINESSKEMIPPSNTSIFIDGDDISWILSKQEAWWQTDLRNDTLAPYLEDDNKTLDVESNQALVLYRYADNDATFDRLLVFYQIGQAVTEAKPRYIFNVEVHYLRINDDT